MSKQDAGILEWDTGGDGPVVEAEFRKYCRENGINPNRYRSKQHVYKRTCLTCWKTYTDTKKRRFVKRNGKSVPSEASLHCPECLKARSSKA